MKKRLFTLVILHLCVYADAQNIITKVPFDASAVIKYAAGKLTEKVSISKMDTYEFVKSTLLKGIKSDSVTSLKQLGINFEKDIFQYATFRDSASSLITLLPLKDAGLFVKNFNHGGKLSIEKKGYRFIQLSSNTFMGYSDSLAIVMVTSYSNPNNYYTPAYDSTLMATVDTAAVITNMEGNMDMAAESANNVDTIKKTVKSKPPFKKGGGKRPVVKGKKPVKKTIKKQVPDYSGEDTSIDPLYTEDSVQLAEDKKRDKWYAEQDAWTAARQLLLADSIINSSFNNPGVSIETEASFAKLIDKSADMSVWLSYDNLLSQYWSFFYRRPAVKPIIPLPKNAESDTRTGINLYFEKDKMRMEQKLYSGKDGNSFTGKAIYNSKQNSSFINYINAGNIGYFSMSMNTEALERYYYDAMKKYLGNMPYIAEYADMIDVYVDLLDIIIDEKAIADLMPGNFLFVMHDLSAKTVRYKDYEYDKDFNQTEVEKTKTELAPDFTFVMETRNEKFLQKLVNLPVKYAERGKFNYKQNGDYYELIFDSKKYPVDTLFFAVKNGRAVVTTLKSSIDITVNNTAAINTDASAKSFILSNNYAMKLNSKQLTDRIAAEFNTDASKKITDYLSKNVGDITIESKMVDGSAVTSGTFNIAGDHSNSFEFFFNMIDTINEIIEKDKIEKQPVQ